MTRDMTRETLAMTREDSDSRMMTRDSTRPLEKALTRDSTRDLTVMTSAQLCFEHVLTVVLETQADDRATLATEVLLKTFIALFYLLCL